MYKGKTKLNEKQKIKLNQHKEHHTSKHMTAMRAAMKRGKTFKQAHAAALKNVGK